MKKIILIPLVLLIVIPIAFASCTWWNPFTWGDCIGNWFSGDEDAYGICEDETITWETKESVFKKIIYHGSCDNKNVSENCIGQWGNGSWYKEYSYLTHDYYNIIENSEVVCKPTGAVKYKKKVMAYDDFWCKVQNNYIVCYSCFDGRCQYGEGRCQSGETCLEINLDTDKQEFKNSLKTVLKDNKELKDKLKDK